MPETSSAKSNGGQKSKLISTEYFFDSATGAVVVFNLADEESFNDLDFWISKNKEINGDIPYIICGNKTDLGDNAVKKEMIDKKIKELGVEYFDTSAKLNKNVDKAFNGLAIKILNDFLNQLDEE